MITIGLVGGIASGKSTVARLLAGHGARVVDVDRLAHETYAPGTRGFEALVAAFGRGIVGADGAIDRGALGASVFADAAALRKLNAIVWPLTRARIEALKQQEAAAGTAVLVLEAAVHLEAGWRDIVDEVWLVAARPEIAQARLQARSGLTAAETAARIAAQPPDAARRLQADAVIENNDDLASLEQRLSEAWRRLTEREGENYPGSP